MRKSVSTGLAVLPGSSTASNKLIDLRDCEDDEFQRIYHEMVAIRWQMQSPVAKLLIGIKRFRLEEEIRIPWAKPWEWPWPILSAGLQPGMRVLDAGCGSSPLLAYLARRGLDCYGVDKGTGMGKRDHLLRLLGLRRQWGYFQHARWVRRPIRISREGIEDMSFPDESFDRVFCISVLEHLSENDWPIAMREMARVLRPSGRLVLTMDLWPFEQPWDCEQLVAEGGLRLVGERPDYSIPKEVRHSHTYDIVGMVLEK